jgi:hypothetical protein
MAENDNFDKLQEEAAQLLQTNEQERVQFYAKKNANLPWLVVILIVSLIFLIYIIFAKAVNAWPFAQYNEPAVSAEFKSKLPKSFQE